MSDHKALIARARRPEKTVPITLDVGLADEFEQTEKALEAAQEKPARLDGNPEARQLAERLAELREQMQASRLDFRLRALPRKKWLALKDEHPPRKGTDGEPVPTDRHLGVNVDEFFAALLRLSVVAPELDDEDWASLLDDDGVLNDGQFNKLSVAAYALNEGEVDIPFSLAGSRTLLSEPE